jgi:hypothetical protein
MTNLLEKTIRDNQDEFINMVINFVNQKTTTKQKKSSKTILHFQALGKTYDSDIFTRNYTQFLMDVSKILSYDEMKPFLNCFLRKTENEFPESHNDNSSKFQINNGGFVSTYSSTEKKIEHIKGLCGNLGINIKILN